MEITIHVPQVDLFTSGDMTDFVLDHAQQHFDVEDGFAVVSIEWEGPQDSRGHWVFKLDDYGQLSPDGWDRSWDMNAHGWLTVRTLTPGPDLTPWLTSVTVEVEASGITMAEVQALAIVGQAGLKSTVAPDSVTSIAHLVQLPDSGHLHGARYEVTVWAYLDEEARSAARSADLIRQLITAELNRISDGQGVDEDGVPFGAGDPTHQVTAYGNPRHLNFSLIPCWSDFHATLEYHLAQIERPDWSVALAKYDRQTDAPGPLLEQRHAYRVAAGDQADGECDCGKGDWCPQYGAKATIPLPRPVHPTKAGLNVTEARVGD